MTNPNIPSFEDLRTQQHQIRVNAERAQAENIAEGRRQRAERGGAFLAGRRDEDRLLGMVADEVRAVSEMVQGSDLEPLRTESVTLEDRRGHERLDLYELLDYEAGGYKEPVLLAPQLGSLVVAHMFVPTKLRAENIGMSPEAFRHRKGGNITNWGKGFRPAALHVDSIPFFYDVSKAVADPETRVQRLRVSLANLAVTAERGRMPASPLREIEPPKEKKSFEIPHQVKGWF
jgi:hypothetical protein